MSGKISGLVWDCDLPQSYKFILLAYADHADHEGKNIFPSIALVAWKTGFSERHIQRVKSELIEKGIFSVEGTSNHGTTLLRINVDKLPVRVRNTKRGDSVSPLSGTKTGQTVTLDTGGVTQLSHQGGDTIESPEPSINRQLNIDIKEKIPEKEPDDFSKMQAIIETLTGYPATQKDTSAIEEMIRLNVIEEDVRAAVEFFASNDRVARGAASILESVKFHRGRRIQSTVKANGGNGNGKHDRKPGEKKVLYSQNVPKLKVAYAPGEIINYGEYKKRRDELGKDSDGKESQ